MRASIVLICCLIVGCAATNYRFLGSDQPEYAAYACPKKSKQCLFDYDNNQGEILDGFYSLESLAGGGYRINGAARVDISETSKEYQKIKKLHLTFIFFQGDLVVHEEIVKLRGELGKFIEFSQPFEINVEFESSAWVWFSWRLSG